MKKLTVLLAAVISLSVAFTSCDKDNDPKSEWDVDAQVVNGASYNSSVDSVYLYLDDGTQLVGKAKYENGGFKMNLLAVAPENLVSMGDDLPEGITMSDKTAKTAGSNLFAGIKNGEFAGAFFLTNLSIQDIDITNVEIEDIASAAYLYTDKDVKITGTESYTSSTQSSKTTYNLSLKQGWNLIAINILANTATTSEVELVNLKDTKGYKWYFIPGQEAAFAPRASILRK